MASRSVWDGAISFGMVSVPVKLYTAVSEQHVRFNQINSKTGNRISQRRVDSKTNEEVPYADIVKGYEVSDGRYVTVTQEQLNALMPRQQKALDIEKFVDADELDPLMYGRSYYVTADNSARAYKLLVDAMGNKVAIGSMVLRDRQHRVALRVHRSGLVATLLNYADEIREQPSQPEDTKVTPRERKMAKALVAALSGSFNISDYHDEFRDAVMAMIDGQTPEVGEEHKVVDIAQALELSLAA